MSKAEETRVDTLIEADQAMREIKELDRFISEVELELNRGIDRLKNDAEVRVAEAKASRAGLDKAIMDYLKRRKGSLFKRTRTERLTHGEVGIRRQTVVKPQTRVTWKEVLGRLVALGAKDAIKTKLSVDREALERWTDDRLQTAKLRRVETDQLFYRVSDVELGEGGAR